jgi:hypothetical protein
MECCVFQVKRFCRKRKAPTKRLPLREMPQTVVHGSTDTIVNTEDATVETIPVSTPMSPLTRDMATQTEFTQCHFAEASTQTLHADMEKEILKLQLEKRILENKIRLLEDSLQSYTCTSNVNEKSQSNSKCTNVQSFSKNFSWADVQNDNKLFKFYTGISFSTFQTIWEFLGEAKCKLSYWNRDSVDKEKTPTKKPGPGRKLHAKEEFFLTLVRLRLGLLHEDVAFRFGVSVHMFQLLLSLGFNFCTTALNALRSGSRADRLVV